MTPQEREVINGIFDRLKGAANQPRDPEAERHIADLLRQQPYAPYALAQSVYVQEQALANMQAEVEQLQAQVAQMQQAQMQQAQQQQTGGFLSGLFGGGGRPAQPAAPQPGPWGRPQGGGMPMQQEAPQGSPWSRGAAAAPAAPAAGGSSFLGTALTTAAGVAGGMVAGNMLMNAFKGSGHGSSEAQTAASDFQPFSQSRGEQHAANTANEDEDEADYGDDFDGGGDSYEA